MSAGRGSPAHPRRPDPGHGVTWSSSTRLGCSASRLRVRWDSTRRKLTVGSAAGRRRRPWRSLEHALRPNDPRDHQDEDARLGNPELAAPAPASSGAEGAKRSVRTPEPGITVAAARGVTRRADELLRDPRGLVHGRVAQGGRRGTGAAGRQDARAVPASRGSA